MNYWSQFHGEAAVCNQIMTLHQLIHNHVEAPHRTELSWSKILRLTFSFHKMWIYFCIVLEVVWMQYRDLYLNYFWMAFECIPNDMKYHYTVIRQMVNIKFLSSEKWKFLVIRYNFLPSFLLIICHQTNSCHQTNGKHKKPCRLPFGLWYNVRYATSQKNELIRLVLSC